MLQLRLATYKDCALIWSWANDPEVRAVSFFSQPIPWETHVKWFQNQLESPNAVIFIAINTENNPIGQIRYALKGTEAEMSISLDRQFRGRGYGVILIQEACQKIHQEYQVTCIHAYIKSDNSISLKTFSKAGFRVFSSTIVNHISAIHLISEF